jgi:hypothetical protein
MMWLRLSVILLALGLQGSFPAKTPDTFRQRYGNPVSETFLIRPTIVVTARYGTSGNTCELVISPNEPGGMIKRWPSSEEIDYQLLGKIEDELVPKLERGEYKMGTFLDITCFPEDDCAGSQEDWENIVIYKNAGKTGAHYEVIRWNRDECGQKIGMHHR